MNKKVIKKVDSFATVIIILAIVLLFSSIWFSGMWVSLKMFITSIILFVWGYALWDKVKQETDNLKEQDKKGGKQ